MFDVYEALLQKMAFILVVVERAVQFIKKIIKYNDWAPEQQASIDIGLVLVGNVALCYFLNLDAFRVVGLVVSAKAVWVGSVLTGVFATAGSELFHEFLKILLLWKERKFA